MFDLFPRPKRRGAAWLTSVVLHGAGGIALLTLHFTGTDRALAARFHAVALVAPQLTPPAHAIRTQARPRAIMTPRVFQATLTAPIAPRERIVIEAPPAAPIVVAVPLPPQLPAVSLIPEPKIAVKAAGFAAAETSSAGPSRGHLSAVGAFNTEEPESSPTRGKVTQVGGFGSSTTVSATIAHNGKVGTAGFGDAVVAAAAPTRRATGPAAFSPVEILSKPRPQYTDDARRKQVEGEVLLEMLFGATGEARVLRLVRGLGHGLDENAIAAAREIRFRPAQRDGGPVDSAAVVHIVFQLAF